MILCSAEPRIISCLPTHVINLVINDNSLEILYIYVCVCVCVCVRACVRACARNRDRDGVVGDHLFRLGLLKEIYRNITSLILTIIFYTVQYFIFHVCTSIFCWSVCLD